MPARQTERKRTAYATSTELCSQNKYYLAVVDFFASPVHVSPSRLPYVLVLPVVFASRQLLWSAPTMEEVVLLLAQLWPAVVVEFHLATANKCKKFTHVYLPLPSNRHNLSNDGCLEVKSEGYRNCSVFRFHLFASFLGKEFYMFFCVSFFVNCFYCVEFSFFNNKSTAFNI